MERKQACIDESIEFLCPTCGASAFEVIGTQQHRSDGAPTTESLVMECLLCLEQFHRPIRMQEPCWPCDEAEETAGSVAAPC